VTRPGLVLGVGEPAINPVPRKMISDHLTLLAAETGYRGGFDVTVNVEGGEALALKTMNPGWAFLAGCRSSAPAASSGRSLARRTSPRFIKASMWRKPTVICTSPPAPATPAKTPCAGSTICRKSP
jgi:hypothetical protein